MNIYFDLDGTLIDSKERLYRLFQQLVPASRLSFDAYWNFKKNKIGHPEILKKEFHWSDVEIEKFKKVWLVRIEDQEWLAYDKPFEGVTEYLKKLRSERHRLFIVTARQFSEPAFRQVERFGWQDLFQKIFITEGKREKLELLKEEDNLGHGGWMIGDTGKDIQTGKAAGLHTCAVLTGFLSEEKLREYQPDKIINMVTDFEANNNEQYDKIS